MLDRRAPPIFALRPCSPRAAMDARAVADVIAIVDDLTGQGQMAADGGRQ